MTMTKMIDEANRHESVKKVLTLMMNELHQKDDVIKKLAADIIQLKNEVTELEERVTDQERYDSNNCLLANLTASVVNFFSQNLNFRKNTGAIKACHPLNKGNSFYPPAVIVITQRN